MSKHPVIKNSKEISPNNPFITFIDPPSTCNSPTSGSLPY